MSTHNIEFDELQKKYYILKSHRSHSCSSELYHQMRMRKRTSFYIIMSVLICAIYFGIFWNNNRAFPDKSSSLLLKPLIDNLTSDFNKSTKRSKTSQYGNSGHLRRKENMNEMRLRDNLARDLNKSTLTLKTSQHGSSAYIRRKENIGGMRMRTGRKHIKDLMAEGPFNFLPNYRNPCWLADERKFPPIKCLPYFYLVGANKCGTTDLYSRITKHPSVTLTKEKEPHWLNRKNYSKASATLDYYKTYFRQATIDIYLTKQDNSFHPTVFGDASASTIWDNEYWKKLPQYRNLSEPLYTNADYIHHRNPKTKIIVILRNPVDRLFSSYMYFQEPKRSPELFHEAVVEAIDYFNTCLVNHTLRYCVYSNRPANDTNVLKRRIVVGIYFVHLNEYFRVFPRRQIHVMKLEDYSKNISSAMTDLFDFLELEPLSDASMRQINMVERQNVRSAPKQAEGKMLPQTKPLLEDFHRPYNRELVKLLGEKFDYNN